VHREWNAVLPDACAGFAATPEPPYYVVVFSARHTGIDQARYAETARRMFELAAEQDGFLGAESAHGPDGFGITVSYWDSLEAIAAWRANAEHSEARRVGRETWYAHYAIRVARVERAYAK
jgi:heme-degrading monooxygenase HmoA